MNKDNYAREIIESLRAHNIATDEELMQIREYLTA